MEVLEVFSSGQGGLYSFNLAFYEATGLRVEG